MRFPDCQGPNPEVIPAADVVDVDALAAASRVVEGNDAAAGDAINPGCTDAAAPSSPLGDGEDAPVAIAVDARARAGGRGESPTRAERLARPSIPRVAADPTPRRAADPGDVFASGCPAREPAVVDRPDDGPAVSAADTESAWATAAAGPPANQAPAPILSAPAPNHAYGCNRPRPRVRCRPPPNGDRKLVVGLI